MPPETIRDSHQTMYGNAIATAESAMAEAIETFNANGFGSIAAGWKWEGESQEDVIFSKQTPNGKLFVVRSEASIPIEYLVNDIWKNTNQMAEWHCNFEWAKVIVEPTNGFDVIQYANKAILTVSGREFLVARTLKKMDNCHYIVGRSCQLEHVPMTKGKVRAYLHLGAVRLRPHPEKLGLVSADYLLCCDLKGIIPRMIVNNVMSHFLLIDCDERRKRRQQMIAAA